MQRRSGLLCVPEYEQLLFAHHGANFTIGASQAVYTGGAITHGIALTALQEQNARLNPEVNRNRYALCLVEYDLDLYFRGNE